MADFSKSEVQTFLSEKDLNEFLRSGAIAEIIAIVPKMSHFVIFFIRKNVSVVRQKTISKGE